MGNTNSSAVQKCLNTAVGGNGDLVAFNNKPLFLLTDVKRYNLDIEVTPAAVTYPQTVEHVSNIIKCAASNNLKVQARSGGHSYGNYGTCELLQRPRAALITNSYWRPRQCYCCRSQELQAILHGQYHI